MVRKETEMHVTAPAVRTVLECVARERNVEVQHIQNYVDAVIDYADNEEATLSEFARDFAMYLDCR